MPFVFRIFTLLGKHQLVEVLTVLVVFRRFLAVIGG